MTHHPHVLPKGQHRIRHYGFFGNGNRAANIARIRKLLGAETSDQGHAHDGTAGEPDAPARVLALPCPRCGGRLIIVKTIDPHQHPRAPPGTVRAAASQADRRSGFPPPPPADRVAARPAVENAPDMIAPALAKVGGIERAVIETGRMSPAICHGLRALDVPIVCIDARQAHQSLNALKANKTDLHDEAGLAQLARTGFYKEVHVKSPRRPWCAQRYRDAQPSR